MIFRERYLLGCLHGGGSRLRFQGGGRISLWAPTCMSLGKEGLKEGTDPEEKQEGTSYAKKNTWSGMSEPFHIWFALNLSTAITSCDKLAVPCHLFIETSKVQMDSWPWEPSLTVPWNAMIKLTLLQCKQADTFKTSAFLQARAYQPPALTDTHPLAPDTTEDLVCWTMSVWLNC